MLLAMREIPRDYEYHELHSWHVEILQLTQSFVQWHRQQVAQLQRQQHWVTTKPTDII